MLPILLIVGLLCLSVSPVSPDLLLSFFLGSILIIVGMGIFTLGAETSMTPIGNRIGTSLTKSRNLPLILLVSLVLGFSITIAEPDLQVLAETVPHINNTVLLVTVGLGVGFFLAVCMLRIIRGIQLRWLLLIFYGIVFALAAFADSDFLSVAFDSGGVTTGPMTVPFILALGVGTYYDLPAADFFSVESTFITAGMVQQIHLRGKTISAWTVNRQQDAEKMLQLGVDDLITDKPEIIAPLLARDKALDNRLLWLRDQLQELFNAPDAEETMEVEETIEDAIEDPEEVLNEA